MARIAVRMRWIRPLRTTRPAVVPMKARPLRVIDVSWPLGRLIVVHIPSGYNTTTCGPGRLRLAAFGPILAQNVSSHCVDPCYTVEPMLALFRP